jgi:hypothetical protein
MPEIQPILIITKTVLNTDLINKNIQCRG